MEFNRGHSPRRGDYGFRGNGVRWKWYRFGIGGRGEGTSLWPTGSNWHSQAAPQPIARHSTAHREAHTTKLIGRLHDWVIVNETTVFTPEPHSSTTRHYQRQMISAVSDGYEGSKKKLIYLWLMNRAHKSYEPPAPVQTIRFYKQKHSNIHTNTDIRPSYPHEDTHASTWEHMFGTHNTLTIAKNNTRKP